MKCWEESCEQLELGSHGLPSDFRQELASVAKGSYAGLLLLNRAVKCVQVRIRIWMGHVGRTRTSLTPAKWVTMATTYKSNQQTVISKRARVASSPN